MPEGRFDEVKPGGVLAAVLAVGASTLVELASNAPGLAAATGIAVQAVTNIAGTAIEQRHQRAAASLQHAADTAGLSLDQLEHRIVARPITVELTARALDAAARTNLEAKIRALGTALATGALAEDDALVDQELIIVQALTPLEAPHVKVLHLASTPRVPSPDGDPYRKSYLNWADDDLIKRYPQAADTMHAILGTLVGVGALAPTTEAAWHGGTTYEISPFGRALLARLMAVGNPTDH
jgi:hypothetical protein